MVEFSVRLDKDKVVTPSGDKVAMVIGQVCRLLDGEITHNGTDPEAAIRVQRLLSKTLHGPSVSSAGREWLYLGYRGIEGVDANQYRTGLFSGLIAVRDEPYPFPDSPMLEVAKGLFINGENGYYGCRREGHMPVVLNSDSRISEAQIL